MPSDDTQENLAERVRRLEARLAAVEERLSNPSMSMSMSLRPPPAPVEPQRVLSLTEPPVAIVPPSPPPGPLTIAHVPALPGEPIADEATDVAGLDDASDASPPPPLAPAVAAYPPRRDNAPVAHGSLEQTIGLQWAGWVGAIVLVIGAGLGIKFAYDQGWLGGLPATVKLLLLWLASFGLIGAGEYVYRRINRVSAAGLYGAGVALLFVVSYAGHDYFGVYARETAFVLMGLSTLIGSAVALRGRLVSIAVLSLLGGHLAPLLLGGSTDSDTPLLVYLIGLQVVALLLAWRGGTTAWWTLRTLSLVLTTVWLAVLLAGPHGGPGLLPFLLVIAALYHAELIASAARHPRAGAGVVFSVAVTALLTLGALVALDDAPAFARGMWVAGLAVACATLGFTLTRRGTTSRRALAVGYRVQAILLAVAAVPVAFTGVSVLIGWGAMALALGVLGRRLSLALARSGAVLTWVAAVAYLALWATGNAQSASSAAETWFAVVDVAVPAYWCCAMVLALVGNVLALLRRRSEERETEDHAVVVGLTIAAAGVVIVASVAALPALGATATLTAYAWVLFAVDLVRPRTHLARPAAAIVAAAVVKWVVVDALADRLSRHWSAAAHATLLNPLMGVGLFLAVTLVAIGWLRRDTLLRFGPRPATRVMPAHLATIVLAMLTIGLTFEIDRQLESARGLAVFPDLVRLKQLAWTVLWTTALAAEVGLLKVFARQAGATTPHDHDHHHGDSAAPLGVLAVLLAVKFVLADTLAYRLTAGVAGPGAVVNFQRLAAALLIGCLIIVRQHARRALRVPGAIVGLAGTMAMVVALWQVSVEIDAFAPRQALADAWVFRQVGWSVCWSAFAVACVSLGFVTRQAGMRYFGLVLFCATLVKVTLIDLSAASTGYRILSFVGLGALLLGTSVLYGKVSPKLLDDADAQTSR